MILPGRKICRRTLSLFLKLVEFGGRWFFSGGKFPKEVDTDINSRQDRIKNLQVCLSHLKSAGVDLTAIDAEGKISLNQVWDLKVQTNTCNF